MTPAERIGIVAYRFRFAIAILSWSVALAFLIGIILDLVPWDTLKTFGYLGVFLINLISGASLVLAGPGQLVAFLGAKGLHPLPLGIVAGIGTAMGESSGYVLGYTGKAFLPQKWGERIKAIRETRLYRRIRSHDFAVLFLLALVPNPVFDLISLAAGAMKYKFSKFFPPVLLGKIARFILIAYAGAWLLRS